MTAPAAARTFPRPQPRGLSSVQCPRCPQCPQHGGGEDGGARRWRGHADTKKLPVCCSSVLGLVITAPSVRCPAGQGQGQACSLLSVTVDSLILRILRTRRLGEAFSQKSIFSSDSSEDAALAATHRHKQMKISPIKLKVSDLVFYCNILWYFHQWVWGESDVIMLYRRHNIKLSTSSPHLQSPPKYLISRHAVWGQATPRISSPLFAKNICENVLN